MLTLPIRFSKLISYLILEKRMSLRIDSFPVVIAGVSNDTETIIAGFVQGLIYWTYFFMVLPFFLVDFDPIFDFDINALKFKLVVHIVTLYTSSDCRLSTPTNPSYFCTNENLAEFNLKKLKTCTVMKTTS